MIGLAGAHRVGKTTLAKAFAEAAGIPYLDLSFSQEILHEMGLTSLSQINSIEQRLYHQLRRMQLTENALIGWKELFVTDRTPLDVAAYAIADFGQTMSEQQIATAQKIVEEGYRITNARFKVLVHVYPGIPYVADEGKPTPNAAYQEHIHALITGMLADTRNRVGYYYLDRDTTDADDRLKAMGNIYRELVKGAMQLQAISTLH